VDRDDEIRRGEIGGERRGGEATISWLGGSGERSEGVGWLDGDGSGRGDVDREGGWDTVGPDDIDPGQARFDGTTSGRRSYSSGCRSASRLEGEREGWKGWWTLEVRS
jgi:hypothetical protein